MAAVKLNAIFEINSAADSAYVINITEILIKNCYAPRDKKKLRWIQLLQAFAEN